MKAQLTKTLVGRESLTLFGVHTAQSHVYDGGPVHQVTETKGRHIYLTPSEFEQVVLSLAATTPMGSFPGLWAKLGKRVGQ